MKQLVWTLFVGLAVLAAALYQVSAPRSVLTNASAVPDAVRTGKPMVSDYSRIPASD